MKSRPPYWIFFWKLRKGPYHLWVRWWSYSPNVCLYHTYRRSYANFNDFTKSRRPYLNYVSEIIRGPGPPSTSGYDDGHWVQMYISITNTEGVMAVLLISLSGGGHIGFFKCHSTKFCPPSGKCCLRPLWTHINRQKKSVQQFHLKCYLVNVPPD